MPRCLCGPETQRLLLGPLSSTFWHLHAGVSPPGSFLTAGPFQFLCAPVLSPKNQEMG